MNRVLILCFILFASTSYSQIYRCEDCVVTAENTFKYNILCNDNYLLCANKRVRSAFDKDGLERIKKRHLGLKYIFIIYKDAYEFGCDINREYRNKYMIEDYNFQEYKGGLIYTMYVVYEKNTPMRDREVKIRDENVRK